MNTGETNEPVVLVEGAVKRFGETLALGGVDLRVEGGVHGLLGGNGAGKSTLFRALLDLVRLDEGRLVLAGHDTVRAGREARAQLGYLPEDLVLEERLTGWEHLELVASLRGLDNVDERTELLDYFGLAESRHQLMGGYSLGMRKKIGLAAALMGSPRVALLDEPLNGLDTEHMRRLRLRIEVMKKGGTTFLLSSHVMSFVERVCDSMTVLASGRVVAEGTVDEVRAVAGLGDVPFEDVFLALTGLGSESGS